MAKERISDRLKLITLLCVVGTIRLSAQNSPPAISTGEVHYDKSARKYVVSFDVFDREHDSIELTLAVSSDSGETFNTLYTRDVGNEGKKRIRLEWQSEQKTGATPYIFRVVADDNQPFDRAAIANRVDMARLTSHFNTVYGERSNHSKGSKAKYDSVRNFIARYFAQSNLDLELMTWSGGDQQMTNILGKKDGLTSNETIVLGAHYDTVDGSPGADDNTSGVIALIELAACISDLQFAKSILLVAFDGEEKGLLGSHHFLEQIAGYPGIKAYLNYDMIGYASDEKNSQPLPPGMDQLFPAAYNELSADEFRGNFLLLMSNDSSTHIAKIFQSNARQFVQDLKLVSIVIPQNGLTAPTLFRASDHAGFWDKSIPAISIGDTGNIRNPHYHSPEDTRATINFKFLGSTIRASVAALAELAGICHCSMMTIK